MADDIIDRLLRVQAQDLLINECETELKALPERIKTLDNNLESYRAAIAEAEEQRKSAQLEIKKIELDIEDQRQKTMRLREQQMALKTNREFRAMEEEIAVARLRIERLETTLLEAMEKADALAGEIAERRTELAGAEQQISKEQACLNSRRQEIESELEGMRLKRSALAETIPPEWLLGYDRLFDNKRDRVLVDVDNGTCGGCHMKLPPAIIHSTRRAEAQVTCYFCGRMLYSVERMS